MKSLLGVSTLLLVTGGIGCGHGSPAFTDVNAAKQAFVYGQLKGIAEAMSSPVVATSANVSVLAQIGNVNTLELGSTWDIAHTKIAFTSAIDGAAGIYTMYPDGSNPVRITKSPVVGQTPTWSPDGSQIAFGSADGHLYVMSADGSNQHKLTTSSATDGQPVWSPDGTRIAFSSNRAGPSEIYVISPDGSNLSRLTSPPITGSAPSWAPDCSRIAFVGNIDGNSGICSMNANGSNPVRLISTGYDPLGDSSSFDRFPSWSPDGSRIALVSFWDGGLYVMNTDGSGRKSVTYNASPQAAPSWSPDGSRVAFQYEGYTRNNMQVYVVGIDGTNRTMLTQSYLANAFPAWSPYPASRKLIGPMSQMGFTCDGFLYSQIGNNTPASIVTFGRRSDSLPLLVTSISSTNAQNSALTYLLESSNSTFPFTDLRYWNLSDPLPIQLNLASVAVSKGALISFGSQDGLVHSMLLYNSPKGSGTGTGRPVISTVNGQQIAVGNFVGVWAGNGKNLAPQGASTVTMDTTTGSIISFK